MKHFNILVKVRFITSKISHDISYKKNIVYELPYDFQILKKLPKILQIFQKYYKNIKIEWRQSLVPSLPFGKNILVLAAKYYAKADIRVFSSNFV